MLARARFSQEWIDSLPPAPAGKRVTYHDTEAPACWRASKSAQGCALKNDPGWAAAQLRAARGQV